MAGRHLSGSLGYPYLKYLLNRYPEAGGQTDLCAYFFRRAWELISISGVAGFLATNSISQGDTRKASLEFIIQNSGQIIKANKSLKWPGEAAVYVSVVHYTKASGFPQLELDGETVLAIDSTLSPVETLSQPKILAQLEGIAFKGTGLGGSWFVLTEQEATSFPHSYHEQGLIKPYIIGRELASFAPIVPQRFCIDLGNSTIDEAKEYKDLLDCLVHRIHKQSSSAEEVLKSGKWWRHRRSAGRLYERIAELGLHSVIAKIQTTSTWAFVKLPVGWIYTGRI